MPSTNSTRVALVTGGAQGLGEAIALRLADDGVDVAVLDLENKVDKLKEVVKKIKAKGRRATYIVGDVSMEDSMRSSVETVVATLGALDIVRPRLRLRFPRS